MKKSFIESICNKRYTRKKSLRTALRLRDLCEQKKKTYSPKQSPSRIPKLKVVDTKSFTIKKSKKKALKQRWNRFKALRFL